MRTRGVPRPGRGYTTVIFASSRLFAMYIPQTKLTYLHLPVFTLYYVHRCSALDAAQYERRRTMQNQKLAQHLWLNCYAKFFDGRLIMTARFHRRDWHNNEPGDVEEKAVYTFITAMSHCDEEPIEDIEITSMHNYAPLLVAIKREYPPEVLRQELRDSLEDYYSGGSGELPVVADYGQTTHCRDLEPLSW